MPLDRRCQRAKWRLRRQVAKPWAQSGIHSLKQLNEYNARTKAENIDADESLQIYTQKGQEDLLLSIAAGFEAQTQHKHRKFPKAVL